MKSEDLFKNTPLLSKQQLSELYNDITTEINQYEPTIRRNKPNESTRGKDQKQASKEERRTNYLRKLQLRYRSIESDNELQKLTLHDLCVKIPDIVCDRHREFTVDDDDVLNKISLLIKLYPEVLLHIAKFIPDPPTEIIAAINHGRYLVDYDPFSQGKSFHYNAQLEDVIDPDFRYMPNVSIAKLTPSMERGSGKSKVYDDYYYAGRMFTTLGYQSRWGNVWNQIFSLLLYKEVITEADALQRTHFNNLSQICKYGYEHITVQTIFYLLRRFSELPFYIIAGDKLVLNRSQQSKWTTSLLPLIYSLMELSKEERGFNYVRQPLIGAIILRITSAYTSLEERMLERKSFYSGLSKLIYDKLGIHCRNVLDINQHLQKGEIVDKVQEIFLPGEREKLAGALRETDVHFRTFFNKTINMLDSGDPIKNTETARFLLGLLNNYGNPGIYYKTSLVLEKIKSIGAQYYKMLDVPEVKTFMLQENTKIPLDYDFSVGEDGLWGNLKELYNQRLNTCVDVLREGELMGWFVDMLTHKSQGEKVSLELYDNSVTLMSTDPRSKILMSISQARIAAFLLNPGAYQSLTAFFEMLTQKGICTTRFQNNRRSRIVEIVPNADQTAYALVLKVFNEMKKHYADIAVGKQKGGIIDMYLQLKTTGNMYGMSSSSDVSGMDASTQQFLGTMFPILLAERINKDVISPTNYFAFDDSEVTVEVAGEGSQRQMPCSPLAKALLTVTHFRANKVYQLKDKIFGVNIPVSTAIFESGRFDTSAQHTVFLTLVAELAKRKFERLHGTKFLLDVRKFGDDSYEAFSSPNYDDLNKYVQIFTEIELDILTKTGFKLETALSRFEGDFLQQLALCGGSVPKSARSSIYTDERGDSRQRDVLVQLKLICEVNQQASQRVYAPENISNLCFGQYLCIRTVPLLSRLKLQGRWEKYVNTIGRETFFTYPFRMIYFKPFNQRNPPLKLSEDIVIPESSSLSPVGDYKTLIAINYLASEHEKRLSTMYMLEKTDFGEYSEHAVKVNDGYILDLSKLLHKRLDEVGVVDYFILNGFSRSATLSDTRAELLTDDIQRMSSVLTSFYSPINMLRSNVATTELYSKYGISVPESIAYWSQPIHRVKTMFASITESVLEESDLNDKFILYLNRNAGATPQKKLLKWLEKNMIWYSYKKNDHKRTFEPLPYPLIPGERFSNEYGVYTRYAGSPFHVDGDISKLQIALTSKYGKTFDLDAAIKFGLEAKAKGNDALQLFIDAIAIPIGLKNEFKNALEEDAIIVSAGAYQSSFQPANYFSLAGSAKNLIAMNAYQGGYSNATRNILSIIIRDLSMAYPYSLISHDVNLSLAMVTGIRLEKRRALRALGRIAYVR